MWQISLHEMAKEVIVSIIANLAASELGLSNYQLDIRGMPGMGKSETMFLLMESIHGIEEVFISSATFNAELFTGIPVVTEDGATVRKETEIHNKIKDAHKNGKIVLVHIDHVDKLSAEDEKILLNLILPKKRKELYDIEGPVVVIMIGNPKEKNFFDVYLEQSPAESIERRHILELDIPSIEEFMEIKKSKARIVETVKDINIKEAVETLLNKVDKKNLMHSFVYNLVRTYKNEMICLIKKKEGSEIAGVYKYPTPTAFNYVSLHFHAWEVLEGDLTKEIVARTFRGFMGDKVANLAVEFYDQVYKAEIINA